jgi:hypothetical protein
MSDRKLLFNASSEQSCALDQPDYAEEFEQIFQFVFLFSFRLYSAGLSQ